MNRLTVFDFLHNHGNGLFMWSNQPKTFLMWALKPEDILPLLNNRPDIEVLHIAESCGESASYLNHEVMLQLRKKEAPMT